MSPRRAETRAATNRLLGVFTAAAAATGVVSLALGAGSGWTSSVVVAHGATGLALVFLARPKAAIARTGWRRRRRDRWVSVGLAVATIVAVGSGVAHATQIAVSLGPIRTMQLHVSSGLVMVGLAAAHATRHRLRRPPRDVGRRAVLQGAVALVLAAAARQLGTAFVSGRRFTGSVERSALPVTQWWRDQGPEIDPTRWRMRVRDSGGSRELGLEELTALGVTDLDATLDCVGGWWSAQRWRGVPLRAVLAGDLPATVVVRSATGYERRFPSGDADRLFLATGLAGKPLTPGHGAPVRLVAPGRRGFWWVKWVTSVETTDDPWWWQPPLPLQ